MEDMDMDITTKDMVITLEMMEMLCMMTMTTTEDTLLLLLNTM